MPLVFKDELLFTITCDDACLLKILAPLADIVCRCGYNGIACLAGCGCCTCLWRILSIINAWKLNVWVLYFGLDFMQVSVFQLLPAVCNLAVRPLTRLARLCVVPTIEPSRLKGTVAIGLGKRVHMQVFTNCPWGCLVRNSSIRQSSDNLS